MIGGYLVSQFRLTEKQRQELEQELSTTADVRVYRRGMALLQLAEGKPVTELAKTLQVSRQTLYNWQQTYRHGKRGEVLADAPRSGRPARWGEEMQATLQEALAESPQRWGYRAPGWTASLLQSHLEQSLGQRLSENTIRQRLHALGYAWKRFRYVLEADPQREKKASYSIQNQ
jgi:transposase